MIHRNCVLYLGLALILLLQACVPAGVAPANPEPTTLKVVMLPYLSFAPLFIAQEEGYFTEQNLDIDFVGMRRSSEAIPALAQGELDVVPGNLYPGELNSIARGAEIRIVSDKGYYDPAGCSYSSLLVSRRLAEAGALENPNQLRGMRFSVNSTSYTGYLAERLLNVENLTLGDFDVVDLAPAAELDAFAAGTVELTMASEPWLTRLLRSGDTVAWQSTLDVIPNAQQGLILYGPTLLEDNRDAGNRFMVAYLKAVRQYNEGQTERNLDIVSKYTELDQEFLRDACWQSMRLDGQINVESVLDFQTWALDNNLIDRRITQDQFWDPGFVEYANDVLGTTSQ